MKVRRAEGGSAEGRAIGFRRVDCVRLVVDGEHSRAEVTGAVHRYPRTVPVPMRIAARLVADGAPLVIERGMDQQLHGEISS